MVAAADLNADGKPDLIALAEGLPELVWYENPGWQRHIIVSGVYRMIAVTAADLDGDGIPELVLTYGFNVTGPRSKGFLVLLTHDGDPRRPWKSHEFDRVPTAHRVRFLDPDHDGQWILAVAPLVNLEAETPRYNDSVPVFVYKPGEWKRQEISHVFEGHLHGMNVVDWYGDRRQELLTACNTGIQLVSRQRSGAWKVRQIVSGNPEPGIRSGAGEAVLGHIGKRRMIAAIEPWHGNLVVVYREQGSKWIRQVLDESFVVGHAITVGDFNGDGIDEVVAGYRGQGQSVYLYSADGGKGEHWTRWPIDAGDMSGASCVVADFNLDHRPDIACIGDRTANLKIYESTGN